MTEDNRPGLFVVFIAHTYRGGPTTSARLAKLEHVRFMPKHVEEGSQFKGGKFVPFKRTLPDRYAVKDNLYDANGQRCNSIRMVEERFAKGIQYLDEEIARLVGHRQQVIDEAFRHGRGVLRETVEAAMAAKAARREEADGGD